jgi:hypothetical protein
MFALERAAHRHGLLPEQIVESRLILYDVWGYVGCEILSHHATRAPFTGSWLPRDMLGITATENRPGGRHTTPKAHQQTARAMCKRIIKHGASDIFTQPFQTREWHRVTWHMLRDKA